MFGIILILVCIGLFFLYFFMTMGKPVYDCWLKDYDYAHRGLHSEEVPENSIPAFEHAIRQGYAIELDVHLSLIHIYGNFAEYGSDGLKRAC